MGIEGFVDVSALLCSGVYLLLWRGEVVYAGQSTKLHARVATHVSQKGRPRKQMLSPRALPGIKFDQILVQPCVLSDLDRFEKELIERYQPKYNLSRPKPKPAISLEELLTDLVPMLPAAPERRGWRGF